MKRNLQQLMFIILITINVANAQNNGSIWGKVIDAESGEALPGANVSINYGSMILGASTDLDGYYKISPVPPGTYNLRISYAGYGKKELSNVVVNPEKVTRISAIKLTAGETLTGVIISAYKDELIDPESPSKMTIRSEDIERLPENRDIARIAQLVSGGVNVSDDGKTMNVRGSRDNTNGYYVDGVLVQSLANALPGMSIGSVTVYTSGLPARYGDVSGGVIVVESKSYFDLYNQWKSLQKAEVSDEPLNFEITD